MGQITIADSAANSLQVDIAPKDAAGTTGSANTTSGSTAVPLGLTAVAVSVYNPGPERIWVRFDGATAEAQAPSIPVDAGLTLTLPVAATAVKMVTATGSVTNVAIVAMGEA